MTTSTVSAPLSPVDVAPVDSTLAALHAMILASPGDDLPRQMYADRLDEIAGEQTERAEFIRTLLGLDEAEKRPGWVPELDMVGRYGVEQIRILFNIHNCERDAEVRRLRQRERELWQLLREPIRESLFSEWSVHSGPHIPSAITAPAAIVRRGFVDEIRLPLAAFVGGRCERCQGSGSASENLMCPRCSGTGHTPGHAAAIFRQHPVTKVVLSDREPMSNGSVFYFYGAEEGDPLRNPHDLPHDLYLLHLGQQTWSIRNFSTRAAALGTLSAACVAYGRSLAGIAPVAPTLHLPAA